MSRNGVRSFFAIFRAKQKTCEACATQFECASLAKPCWYRKVKLSADALAELASRYTDCVCPVCLNEVARKSDMSGITDVPRFKESAKSFTGSYPNKIRYEETEPDIPHKHLTKHAKSCLGASSCAKMREFHTRTQTEQSR